MAERVVPPHGDDGESRVDCRHERERRSVTRSVVTNLYDIRVEVVARREQPYCTHLTGVSHEKFVESAVTEHDDDAVFVQVVSGVGTAVDTME